MSEEAKEQKKVAKSAKGETKKSLNQQIRELDEQVEWFYSDEFKLEEAVERYRKAAELAKGIEGELKDLQNEIEVLAEDFSKE